MVQSPPSKLRGSRMAAVIMVGLVGTLIFLFVSLSSLRRENAFLRQRLAASEQFKAESAGLPPEPDRARDQETRAEPPTTEMLRLRGQVASLREQVREAEERARESMARLQIAERTTAERLTLEQRRLAARAGPWIGVTISTNPFVEAAGEGSRPGVFIRAIDPNGPASRSLLREGDLIVGIGGKEVTETQQLTNILSATTINQPLRLDVLRHNEAMSIEVTPTEWPR